MTSDLKGHLLGSACCRLSSIGESYSTRSSIYFEGPPLLSLSPHLQQLAKVAIPPLYPSSPRAHSFKLVTRAPTSASSPRTLRRSGTESKLQQDVSLSPNEETCGHMVPYTSMTSFHNHASSCILAADGKVGATIWHALLSARNLALLEWDANLPSIRLFFVGRAVIDPVAGMMMGSTDSTSVDSPTKSLGTLTKSGVLSVDNVGLPILSSLNASSAAMAGGLSEGSWNAAWDVRPARWLHGRHSAWLLFGVCACFSAAAVPLISAATYPLLIEDVEWLPPPAALSEPESEPVESTPVAPQTEQSGHGKEIITDYTVTGIPGDGRCLFRAVAHGSCLRSGKDAPDETAQRELADELRSKVADELIKRRESSEWFIEGDFDQYVERMCQTYVWGGEPELIMLSHVLEMPITVYMIEEKTKGGLISIAEYGQEYSKIDPIQVLYHGFGHYEALQIPSNKAASKL